MFIQRVVMGSDPAFLENFLVYLLAMSGALSALGALTAALTIRKPGAAFLGFFMSILVGFSFFRGNWCHRPGEGGCDWRGTRGGVVGIQIRPF